MSSTLSEGVRVPDIGSVNWGADVNFNWGLLNTALANISGNVKVDAENTWTAPQTFTETISGSIDGVAARAVGDEDGNNIKTALAGKQPSLSQSQLAAVNSGITAAGVQQIADNAAAIAGKQDELTAAQQAAVDSGATMAKIDQIASNASAIVSLTSSKQDSLSTAQLAAVNSGITSAAVQQISTNASNISGLQTAVAGKAADADVVHLAGTETITGDKTWTGLNTYQRRLNLKDATAISAGGFGVGLNFYDYEGNRYGYILPHVTSGGTKNIVFTNTASGYLEFASPMVTQNVIPEAGATYNLGDPTKWYKDTYTNTVWVQGVRAPGTSNALILAAMETWEDGARIFMYGKDNANGSAIYADVDHNDGNHDKTGVTLNKYGFYPAGISRHLGLADANNRWLTFNGINPGALGMPDNSAYIDISANIIDRAYGSNSFVAAATGWIAIGSFATAIQIANDTTAMATTALPGSDGYASLFLPVRANDNVRVLINQTSTTFQTFKLYPCLGNV